MFKIEIRRLTMSVCAAFLFFLLLASFHTSSPRAYAATPQVTLSLAGGGTPLSGHVGTKIRINGTGFPGGQINLYTTTNNDPAKCNNNNIGALGLTPFTPSNTHADNNGNFTVDTQWPESASNIGSAYYICAVNSPNVKAVSAASFTVVPQQTINISPITLAAGQQITVIGANWLPPQPLTVTITGPNASSAAATSQVISDQTGNFTSTLTIPATVPAGSYTVSAVADNEPTLKVINNNFVTVTAALPTPTPTITLSPTVTATPSPTPTATVGQNQGSTAPPANTPTDNANTFLLVSLAGLGVLLVIVGVILFIMYSRSR